MIVIESEVKVCLQVIRQYGGRGEIKCTRRERGDVIVAQGQSDAICRREVKYSGIDGRYLVVVKSDINERLRGWKFKCIRRDRIDFIVSQGQRDFICRQEVKNSGSDGRYLIVIKSEINVPRVGEIKCTQRERGDVIVSQRQRDVICR